MRFSSCVFAVCFALSSAASSAERPPSLAEAAAWAAADAKRLTPEAAQHNRYLFLNTPSPEKAWPILQGHLAALSSEPGPVAPIAVVLGSSASIGRIDLRDYGWSRELWDSLPDPYFTAIVETEEDHEQEYGHRDRFGRWVTTEIRTEKKRKRIRAVAPWLASSSAEKEALAHLVKRTESAASIVRADWFLGQTAIQANRKPGYYDFLGVKDRKAFEELIGLDRKLLKRARETELLEAVAESRVAQQPRRIGAFGTVRGRKAWWTFDNKQAVDKANPLRVLTDDFTHDAEEAFGPLPNGFWAWGLFLANGTRQDSAPDFIGPDKTSTSNDGRIHVNLSCTRCHYSAAMGGQAGVQDVDGWARGLFAGKLRLQSPDYETLKDLRAKYLRDLQGPMDDDRRHHARAVRAVTGLEPAEWSKGYGALWADYEDRHVDQARAARDLGISEKDFGAALRAYLRRTGALDPVLAAILAGKSVGVRQWEEAYPLAQLAVKGFVQP